jgi:hypothetical protein
LLKAIKTPSIRYRQNDVINNLIGAVNDAVLGVKKASAHHFKISNLIKEKCNSPNADLADYIMSQYGL